MKQSKLEITVPFKNFNLIENSTSTIESYKMLFLSYEKSQQIVKKDVLAIQIYVCAFTFIYYTILLFKSHVI